MTDLTFNINEEALIHFLMTICDCPPTYKLCTIHGTVTLAIGNDQTDRDLIRALCQEKLRERFSLPARMNANQAIIKNGGSHRHTRPSDFWED